MTQQEKEAFQARLKALEARISEMRTHLDKQANVKEAVKEKLTKFYERSQQLKQAGATDHQSVKELEQGFESWIGDIDKEYGAPPKRANSVSM
jgi:uncharacterized protein (UPF0305 family)